MQPLISGVNSPNRRPPSQDSTASWPGGIVLFDQMTVRPIVGGPVRSSPRLILSTPVVLQKVQAMPTEGRSVTISEHGVLVKLTEPMPISQHDALWLKFPELERRLRVTFDAICYRVVRIEKHDNHQLVALQISEASPNFQRRLSDFIERHKFRYKLDVTDRVECLYTEALQQLNAKYHPFLVCLKNTSKQRHALLVNAINSQPPWHDANFTQIFASEQTSTRLVVSTSKPILTEDFVETMCHALAEISDNLYKQTQKKWRSWDTMDIVLPSPKFKQTEQGPQKIDTQYETIRLDRQRRRAYRRYAVELMIDLIAQGISYRGQSIDVSVDGARVRFQSPVSVEVGEPVRVDFPRLQKRFQKYRLMDQPYRVASVSGDGMTISLTRDHRYFDHGAAKFFEEALPHSADRLEILPDHTLWEAEAAMARKALEKHLPAWILYFHTHHNQWHLTELAYTPNSQSWFDDFRCDSALSLDWMVNAWARKISALDELMGITDDLFVYQKDGQWIAAWRSEQEKPQYHAAVKIFRAYLLPIPKQSLQPWRQRALPIRSHSYRSYSNLLNKIRSLAAIGYLFDITSLKNTTRDTQESQKAE